MNQPDPLIQMLGVDYAYEGSEGIKELLKGIQLHMDEGEWLAVVGSNGCGKSTLAKVAAGLYPPTSGVVKRRLSSSNGVRLVFQNPEAQLIGDTVYEDVCFSLEHADTEAEDIDRMAIAALEKTGMLSLKDKPVAELSGGQKQLTAIASCLAVNPSLLIFDESTSMLDPSARSRILGIARSLKESGSTVVWITQLLDELAWCDRIVAMEAGELIFSGTKAAFFYEGWPEAATVCDRLGYAPPYTVKVARALMEKGIIVNPFPYTPEQLAQAVGGWV